MVDREKVIKALECCAYKQNCIECPYYKGNSTCMDDKDKDALELLKEQEDLGAEQHPQELVRCKVCVHRGKIEKCVLAAIAAEKSYPLFMLDNRGEWFCADAKRAT